MIYEDTTYPEKFSWVLLKETQEYLNGISTFETFKIYQSIVTNRIDYAKIILKEKINFDLKKNKIKQKKKKEKEKPKEEIYCSCRKVLQIDWIACDSGDKTCPGNGWYHITHIDELKDLDRTSFENKFDKYYCPYCREKFGLKNVLKENSQENDNKIKENIEENNNDKNDKKNNNDIDIKKEKSEEIDFVNINNSNTTSNNIENNNNNIENNNNTKMEIEEEKNTKKEESKDEIKENEKLENKDEAKDDNK